ncbi:DNA glycosylase [Tilletiaria anomala UBC 951]|uniref:Adenine DNA glycosylase n=1 Tax=Tilletiaria anomala (strain ATCC 24038 / CBS 436.72 / UBC 951) TaxID=1037660 RepID=A0A066VR86_TILAU|nr:DNA glycosylase [Tilletiaria anomala UBC 951]KDN43971.1 DNA glycosylase [Tilletiaria anomala UBC 951]
MRAAKRKATTTSSPPPTKPRVLQDHDSYTDSSLSVDGSDDDDYHSEDDAEAPPKRKRNASPKKKNSNQEAASASTASPKLSKKDGSGLGGKALINLIFRSDRPSDGAAALPPVRSHAFDYHHPLLLDSTSDGAGAKARSAFLEWYAGVKKDREMPWRADWIDPFDEDSSEEQIRTALKERAYRVWISEVMLQQTRVATVVKYFNRWTAKWPSIDSLAKADAQDVLAAWKGLGYYSRSARIHEAAKKVVNDKKLQGMLPELPEDLSRDVPGVGPYTAGAISSIVFGHAVPIIDGNVVRVLSRQMGLLASSKDKAITDVLWEAARRIVRRATLDCLVEADALSEEEQRTSVFGREALQRSSVPGDWNQALMELGSTICAPKPSCNRCPIQSTCRAYHEGLLAADAASNSSTARAEAPLPDLEDLCSVCAPVPIFEERPALPGHKSEAKASKAKDPGNVQLKQSTISFGGKAIGSDMSRSSSSSNAKAKSKAQAQAEQVEAFSSIVEAHVKLMPLKVEKSKVKEENCAVCIIEDMTRSTDGTDRACSNGSVRTRGQILVEQRPSKGLLANMWQFPTLSFGYDQPPPPAQKRAAMAAEFVGALVAKHLHHPRSSTKLSAGANVSVVKKPPLGVIQHVFSHLVLNMHIYVHELHATNARADGAANDKEQQPSQAQKIADMPRKWCSEAEIARANMGTGMVNVFQRYRGTAK